MPKAEPSGDHAWEVFRRPKRASRARSRFSSRRPGEPIGTARPLHLRRVGGAGKGRHMPHLLHQRARGEAQEPGSGLVALPDDLTVGADYGLTVMTVAPPAACRFAMFSRGEGQCILAKHGFTALSLSTEGATK